jgi:hypothetical protein
VGQTTLSTAAGLHGVNSLQAGTEQSDPFFSTLYRIRFGAGESFLPGGLLPHCLRLNAVACVHNVDLED